MPYKDQARQVAAQKKWYEENHHLLMRRQRDRRKLVRKQLTEYKKNLSCVRCGMDHPACLDFHHTDPTGKENSITNATKNWSWERILQEIQKCIVLCSNCHRIEHYKG